MTVESSLRDFRLTPGTLDIPWERIRAVQVQQQEVEKPNLDDMKALLSLLPTLNLSVKAIHNAPLFDNVHLLKVFQLAVQFSLWSQHVMYAQWQEEVSAQRSARHEKEFTPSENGEEPKQDKNKWRREAAIRREEKERRKGPPLVEGEREEEKEAMWEKYRLYYGSAHRQEPHMRGRMHASMEDQSHRMSDLTASSASTSPAELSSRMLSSPPATPLTPITTTTASIATTSSAASSLVYRLVKDREGAMQRVRELEDSLDHADEVITILREEVKEAKGKYHRFYQRATRRFKDVVQASHDQRESLTHAAVQQHHAQQQQHEEERRMWKRKQKEKEREVRKKWEEEAHHQRREWSAKQQWKEGSAAACYAGGPPPVSPSWWPSCAAAPPPPPPPPPPPVVPSVPVTIYLQKSGVGRVEHSGGCACCTCTCGGSHKRGKWGHSPSHGTVCARKEKHTTAPSSGTPEPVSPPQPVRADVPHSPPASTSPLAVPVLLPSPSLTPTVAPSPPAPQVNVSPAVPRPHLATPVTGEGSASATSGERLGNTAPPMAPATTAFVFPSPALSLPLLPPSPPGMPTQGGGGLSGGGAGGGTPVLLVASPELDSSRMSGNVLSPDTRAVLTEMQKNILSPFFVVPHDATARGSTSSLASHQEGVGLARPLAVPASLSSALASPFVAPVATPISPPPFLGVDRSERHDVDGDDGPKRKEDGEGGKTREEVPGTIAGGPVPPLTTATPLRLPSPPPLLSQPLTTPLALPAAHPPSPPLTALPPPPPPPLVPTLSPGLGGGGPTPVVAPSPLMSPPHSEKTPDTIRVTHEPEKHETSSAMAVVSPIQTAPPPPPPIGLAKDAAAIRRVSSPPSELANSYASLTEAVNSSSSSSLSSVKKSKPLPSFSVSSALLSPKKQQKPPPPPPLASRPFPSTTTSTSSSLPPHPSPSDSSPLSRPSVALAFPSGSPTTTAEESPSERMSVPPLPVPVPVPVPVGPSLSMSAAQATTAAPPPHPPPPPLPLTTDLADLIPPPASPSSTMLEDMPAVSAQHSALLRFSGEFGSGGENGNREELHDVLRLSLSSTPVPSFPPPLPGEATPLFLKSTSSSLRSSLSVPPHGREGNTSVNGCRGTPLLPPRQAPHTASAAHRKDEKKEDHALDTSTPLSFDCRHCGQPLTSVTRHVHESNCEKRPVKCPKCRQSVTASALPNHLCDLSLLFGSKSGSTLPSPTNTEVPPAERTPITASTSPTNQSAGAAVDKGNASASHTHRSQAVKSGRRKGEGDDEASSTADRLNASAKLRGSSILLQETQRELQALLEEEAAEEARKRKEKKG